MSVGKILIVDDDRTTRVNLRRLAGRGGGEVLEARDGNEAWAMVSESDFDLVVTDLVMDGMTGLELLARTKELRPETEVIVMTGYASIPSAIEAIKQGAYHYLEKPFRPEEFRHLCGRALEKRSLARQVKDLEGRLRERDGSPRLIGKSREMTDVAKLVEQVAPADCNVLLTGDSGTGKELAASMIHHLSGRASGKFMAINCGAFTEELLSNELFGHEKGAFTGAVDSKAGLLEAAGGGTLFLDEVGDMPLSMQVKLLRAVQEREVIRVGGNEPVPIDVRIIAATNQDLKKAVSAGLFRQDLFYRLNVVTVRLPPLRERRQDIPLLANHFLRAGVERTGKRIGGFSDQAMGLLREYEYPGNVRELENIVEHAIAMAGGETIDVQDLPADLSEMEVFSFEQPDDKIKPLSEIQREYIQYVLKQTGRNKTRAAKLLGIDRASLWRHLKRYEIGD